MRQRADIPVNEKAWTVGNISVYFEQTLMMNRKYSLSMIQARSKWIGAQDTGASHV